MVSSSRVWGVQFRVAAFGVLLLLGIAGAGQAKAQFVQTGEWGGNWYAHQFQPVALEFTETGELFIGDTGLGRVAKLTAGGELADVWSTGKAGPGIPTNPSPPAQNPSDLTVDPAGNVYVTDQTSRTLKKYGPDGTLTDTWEVTGPGQVHGIEHDASGDLFVLRDETVDRFTTDGELLGSWGGFKSDLADPLITTDDDGHVLVAGTTRVDPDTATKSVWTFDLDGNLASEWRKPAEAYRPYMYAKCSPGSFGPIEDIYGYTGLAAREGGGAWVVNDRMGGLIEGLSPDGRTEVSLRKPTYNDGRLAVGPGGNFWVTSWDNETGGQVNEYSPAGKLLRTYGRTDFPKYKDERGEGLFSQVEDLAVSPGGSVDVFDVRNARTQRFAADGQFDWLADGPYRAHVLGYPTGTHELIYGSGSGARLLDTARKEIHEYSAAGVETSVTELTLNGNIFGGTGLGGSGSLSGQAWIVAGRPARVLRVSTTGQEITSWPTSGLPGPPTGYGATVPIRRNAAGNLLLLSNYTIQEYTTAGSLVRQWTVEQPPGDVRFPVAFGTDATGFVYVLARNGDGASLLIYTPEGHPAGDLPIGPQNGGGGFEEMAVAPDGVLYLSDGIKIFRYERTAARRTSAPGRELASATAIEPQGGPCDYWQDPDPDPERRFRVSSVKYRKGGRVALLRLLVPGPGRVEVVGDRRIRRQSIRVKHESSIRIRVVAKRRYQRPVRKRKQARLRVTVRLRYAANRSPSDDQTTARKLILKRKVVPKGRSN